MGGSFHLGLVSVIVSLQDVTAYAQGAGKCPHGLVVQISLTKTA